jgi:hypothetical protein
VYFVPVLKIFVQKGERVRFVLLMQREKILYMTDTVRVTSFLVDFYALSASASLEYAISGGSNIIHCPKRAGCTFGFSHAA